jgi:hypothetical protein
MNLPSSMLISLMLSATLLALRPGGELRADEAGLPAASESGTRERDGARDFDFSIGRWRTEVSRLLRPLLGSSEWATYEGTSIVREAGGASLVELDVAGPAGRIVGLLVRLYNPESRQWSLNYASRGTLSPPMVGEFRDGRGEFFGQESLNGRAIFVRFVISNITPDSWHYEQSFSDDGGRTWEVNWIAVDTFEAEIDEG